MKRISEDIAFFLPFVLLSGIIVLFFGAVLFFGLSDMRHQQELNIECIAAGKQIIEGNCVDSMLDTSN